MKAEAVRMTLLPGSLWSLYSYRGADPRLQGMGNTVQIAAFTPPPHISKQLHANV